MKLVYRQSLLWVGSMFMPFLFVFGLCTNTIIYFANFVSLSHFYRPPKKPFRASRAPTFFLWLLLFALLVCAVPMVDFLFSNANTGCGPMRPESCEPANLTCGAAPTLTCHETQLNIQAFRSIMPHTEVGSGADAESELVTSFNDCNNIGCYVGVFLRKLFLPPVLITALALSCLGLGFAWAKLRGLSSQLKTRTLEFEEERNEKVMLLRSHMDTPAANE
mmetsp:Transcript_27002/g.79021  ORF Transcript_27002/g.79021 Transcript_27002/m.79021 type:complete len:220 (-) Transcript_27002:430-1089(-)